MTEEEPAKPGPPDKGPQICNCMKVHEATLRAAIRAGATTVEALRWCTRANTGCGTCRPDLERLLQEELTEGQWPEHGQSPDQPEPDMLDGPGNRTVR